MAQEIQGTPVQVNPDGKDQQTAINTLMLQTLLNLQNQVNQLMQNRSVGTGSGRGGVRRQPAKPVLDTKTGKVYHAESAAGLAVAPEYGLPTVLPNGRRNSFVWYQVIGKDPNRFKAITVEEYNKRLQASAQVVQVPEKAPEPPKVEEPKKAQEQKTIQMGHNRPIQKK